MTNQMLEAFSRVWESPKWRLYATSKEPKISEGSYVCEVISPLVNIVMSNLPIEYTIWGAW